MQEKYIVPEKPWARPVTPETLPKPVIFHDGRLVKKPTPLRALLIVFWLPIGVLLSILRIFIITRCPISLCYHVLRLLGCPISVKGNRPSQLVGRGVAMVCSHRNVVDPLMVSAALRRPATSVSYSVSRITEFMSPIKTHRLTRNRSIDAKLINDILEHGSDLVMFPEGTTCRTPYLLRFSSLFAELTDRIVPVAISIKTSMFHGSTARGYKCLDTFFLFMNPFPTYEITFLDMLPADRTCGAGGRSSYEVANDIQEMIAKCLNFKCTNLTRKDKYRVLARTDGLVGQNS